MIVVFDTNSYRDLVAGIAADDVEPLMRKLLELETAKGITAMMSTFVAEEILGHLLDDESTRTYRACVKATKALYMHCGDEHQYRLVPSPQTQLAKEFFGVESKRFLDTQQAVALTAFEVSKDLTKENINRHEETLKKIKAHLQNSEKELADGILEMGRKLDSSYTDWNLFVGNQSMRTRYLNFIKSESFRIGISAIFLSAVGINLEAEGLITTPTQEEFHIMIQDYMQRYEAPINMQVLFYELVLQPGFDVTKNSHANFLWDTHILHVAGHSISDDDIILVTSDKAMIHQANKAIAGRVYTLNDYKAFVGL